MRNLIYTALIAMASMLTLAGCDKESNFQFDAEKGRIDCNAISVDYIRTGTRAGVETGDFRVNFIDTKTNTTIESFLYSEMPEYVALPAGDYRAEAVYGDGTAAAEWENPYYKGSSSFSIEAGKITKEIAPIKCSLKNMKVDVEVADETGMDIVGKDVCVTVTAGRSSLEFKEEYVDSTGYFKYVEGSRTIVAEFSGTVDDMMINDVRKTYDNAAPGNAYRIIFHINRPDNTDPGSITTVNGEITIDATIQIINVEEEVDPDSEQPYLEDDMRPTQDPNVDPNPGTDPDPGTDPSDNGPHIEIKSPGIVLDQECEIDGSSTLAFDVTSETGITDFVIDIDSTTLTPEELEGVGLQAHLDLVNAEGDLKDALEGLGFPTGDKVEGQTKCEFDISGFMPLLTVLGEGTHKFKLSITDAGGTTKATIWLHNN